MDLLLKMNKKSPFRFSIDEIMFTESSTLEVFAKIIPEINSEYFPPIHLRYIHISPELLQEQYYTSWSLGHERSIGLDTREFKGSVEQGGFYEIGIGRLPEDIFNPKYLVGVDNDIFDGALVKDHMYLESNIVDDEVQERIGDATDLGSDDTAKIVDGLYLYGFNVGQGDSLLMVFPNGSVYLIDTNIYSTKKLDYYIAEIDSILKSHNLPYRKLKAFIVTHKHMDHIRGARRIIEKFTISNFVINQDYEHSTQEVSRLLGAAKAIPRWINLNDKSFVKDGDVEIDFLNPRSKTKSKDKCPDINNSSIYFCVRYLGSDIHMTGDIGHDVAVKSLTIPSYWHTGNESVLKVSHHGSRTGTSALLLKETNPKYSFVSVGTCKKYKHPHDSVIDLLSSSDVRMSKKIQKTVCYKVSSNGIQDITND